MDERADGLRRVFWSPEEKRLRALFRVPVAFVLAVLAGNLILTTLSPLGTAVGLPGWARTTLLQAVGLLALLAIVWFIDRRPLRDVGLGLNREWGLGLLVGFAAGFAMVGTVVAALVALGMASVGATASTSGVAGATVGTTLAAALYLTGYAIFEEFIVRGYLLVNVAEGVRGIVGNDRTAVLVAVVTTAVLFGLLHAANAGSSALALANITLAGLLFGLAVAVTGRLAFPIGAHAAWNIGLGPVFGLSVSGIPSDTALVGVVTDGPSVVTGGAFGPEGGVAMLAGLAVGVGIFVAWARLSTGGLAVDERVAVPDLWTTDRSEP